MGAGVHRDSQGEKDWLGESCSFTGSRVLIGAFVLGVLASLLTDARPNDAVRYPLGLALSATTVFAALIVPRRFVILPMFVLMVCSQDLTQSELDIGLHGLMPSPTIWQMRLLGLGPSITIFALLIAVALRLPRSSLQRHQRWLLLYLFVGASLTSFVFGYAKSDIAMFVTDAKFAMFGIGLIAFRRYFAAFPNELRGTMAVFLAMAAGRYAVDFAYLTLGVMRTEISGVNRVSVDSGKGLLVVLMMYLLYKVVAGRWRVRASLLLPLALMLLIAYATRWLLLTLILGVVVFGIFLEPRKALHTGVAVGVLLGASIAVAEWLRPEILDIAQKRLSTLGLLGTGGLEAVDLTRVVSIVNSIHLVWDRHAILVGLGYGSWYTDDYLPYPLGYDLVGGFDADWIASRRFYRVHDFVFHLVLKLGVIGLALYIAAFLTPLVRLWRRRNELRRSQLWEPLVVLWAALATVLTSMYWSSKGLLLSALFVAMADAVERASRPQTLSELKRAA